MGKREELGLKLLVVRLLIFYIWLVTRFLTSIRFWLHPITKNQIICLVFDVNAEWYWMHGEHLKIEFLVPEPRGKPLRMWMSMGVEWHHQMAISCVTKCFFQALNVYWLTHNLITVAQAQILKHKSVRDRLGIPDQIQWKDEDLPMKNDFFGSMSGKNPSNNLLDRIKKEQDKEDAERKKSQTENWYDLQFVITCI